MIMKKKKQRSAQPPPGPGDIKSLIRKNSSFFDTLIELIPAKFYLPTDDDSKPYFQGLNKSAKRAAKQLTKHNINKSRRDRLDPDKKSLSSTLDLLKKATVKSSSVPGDEPVDRIPDPSVTYEELRKRLRRRIEELRGNRGGGEAWRSEKREKRENEYRKRKRGGDDDEVEGDKSGDGGDCRAGNIGKTEGEIEKEVTEASKRIEFGKVKLGEERNKKKKRMSKEKELEMAKRVEEEAKNDPGVAKKHSWKAAVSRAAGDKVHDDPKLLKESMSKEKRRREKNADKWKERVESREKVKGEKQQKRAGNITDRIHQKKMRKIAKREKKLMRPGFEGRKGGYINEN